MNEVLYHANPDKSEEFNHVGKLRNMANQGKKLFNDIDEAVMFWFDCSYPITTLDTLLGKKYDTALLSVCQSFYTEDQNLQILIDESEEEVSNRVLCRLIDRNQD